MAGKRVIHIGTLLSALLLTGGSAMAACLGPGINNGGTNNGWGMGPCSSGVSIRSGGGGGGSVAAGVEGAAAAVQAVGLVAGILGDVVNSMPRTSIELPSLQPPSLPSVSLPSISMPSVSLPQPTTQTPSQPAPARQSSQPPDDRAASCARIARIYQTSHAKIITATQHLDDVDNSHPEKLCEFGRNVGVPLLQENVNAVSAARGEKCFGDADAKRLVSFRKLLADEQHAIAVDCKRAIEGDIAPAAPKEVAANTPAAPASTTHQAPTVPHIAPSGAYASPASNNCSDVTGAGGPPITCPQNNGVPPNVQTQLNQAQSAMQAAKTLKQNSPNYNGWSSAAAQYRQAEAAFRAAGDLSDALAAAEQAQTLENALKIVDQKNSQAAPAASQGQNDWDRLRVCEGGIKVCASGEICLAWSTPAEGAHQDCRPVTPPQLACAREANYYDATDGQNKALMSAACLYHCLAAKATSGRDEFHRLYEISQQRAKNLCSIGADANCNVIETPRCN